MRSLAAKFAVTGSGALLMMSVGAVAFAQDHPDNAGTQILRQVEPPAFPVPAVQPRQEIVVAEPEVLAGPMVSVQGFLFEGNSLFGADRLAGVLQQFVGQELALAELNYAADLIGKFYQERGYFARAVVPAQDVVDGMVRLEIVESRLDGIEIDPSAVGSEDDRLRSYVSGGLQKDEILDLRRIERGALLLNQLPGSSYRTVLRAGSGEGTTSVLLVSEPDAGKRFGVMVDGLGSARAGRERLLLTGNLYPLVAFGDELSITALASRGIQYGRFAYSLPIGTDGFSASVALSGLRYKLLNTPVAIKGDSEAAIVNLRYPLVLQADYSVMVSVEGGYRQFSDRVETAASNRSLVYGSIGFDIGHADQFLGGGDTALGLTVLTGDTVSQGAHARLSGYFQRRQNLDRSNMLSLRVMGQIGSSRLDQSQFLTLNGNSGVAAFSNDEDVSGTSGVLGRATFEHEFAPEMRVSIFYDLGKVYGAPASRPTVLQGVGVGANFQAMSGFTIDASVARPIRAPGVFDNDVKAWVSARVRF